MISVLFGIWMSLVSAVLPPVPVTPCACQIQGTFPTPPAGSRSLFYIQRTPNTNTIMYDLNVVRGQVDAEDPIKEYWIRYGEDGQQEDLSFIQRNYAYGIKSKKLDDRNFELRFVSYKKLPFLLSWSDRDSRYHVYARINDVEIEVSRVFLQIEGGTFWLPNVVCVEVRGVTRDTGKPVVQTFKP